MTEMTYTVEMHNGESAETQQWVYIGFRRAFWGDVRPGDGTMIAVVPDDGNELDLWLVPADKPALEAALYELARYYWEHSPWVFPAWHEGSCEDLRSYHAHGHPRLDYVKLPVRILSVIG